jgi:hypothetical protein
MLGWDIQPAIIAAADKTKVARPLCAVVTGPGGLLRFEFIGFPCTQAHSVKSSKHLKLYSHAADNLIMNPIASPSSVNLQSAQTSGLAAISAGSQRLNQDAQQIANPDSANQTNALLDLGQSLLLTQAGADVISTSNKMLGALLDVLA